MKLTIPETLALEHQELHARLAEATLLPGPLGDAAKAVARMLHPHFVREQEIALPPLGLLPDLARGVVEPQMAEVLRLTDALAKELPRMLAEHQQIVGALQVFGDVARRENQPEYADFARRLLLHARTEEEVLYPAAILLGEYLKLRLAAGRPEPAAAAAGSARQAEGPGASG